MDQISFLLKGKCHCYRNTCCLSGMATEVMLHKNTVSRDSGVFALLFLTSSCSTPHLVTTDIICIGRQAIFSLTMASDVPVPPLTHRSQSQEKMMMKTSSVQCLLSCYVLKRKICDLSLKAIQYNGAPTSSHVSLSVRYNFKPTYTAFRHIEQ